MTIVPKESRKLFIVRHKEIGSIHTVHDIKTEEDMIMFLVYLDGDWQYVSSSIFIEYKSEDWINYIDRQWITASEANDLATRKYIEQLIQLKE